MANAPYNLKPDQGKVTFEIDPVTLRAYLKAIGGLSKEIQNEIRLASQKQAMGLADDLKRSAYSAPAPAAKRVALSITTPKDRLPTVKIGGTKKVGDPYRPRTGGRTVRASAGALLYGTEYGGNAGYPDRAGRKMGNRFKASRNDRGYWINPTAEEWGTYLFKQWVAMVDMILEREGIRG